MRLTTVFAIVALGAIDSTVFAGPVRRADSTTTSASFTTSSSSSTASSTSASTSATTSASLGVTTTASTPTSTDTSPAATDTDRYSPKPTDEGFIECHGSNGPYRPFCQPTNASDVYIGDTYYVTWDPDFFKINTTLEVLVDYTNPQGGGLNVYTSPETPNAYGFVTVSMDNRWLNDNSENNLTFSIIQLDKTPSKKPNYYQGPTVRLIQKPAKHYAPSPETPKPDRKSLAIGLPVALGGALFIVLGVCFWNRKHRQIGIGNIMGRRAGYGVGKSRRQRIGKAGAIRLTETPSKDVFRDEPPRPGHARDTSLGSLVSEGADERTQSNAFRSEVQRQRTGI
ncbi:MAG: hypothetical protein M1814_001124 [Vezdaea aestivalis]|nr:MAG: hypothetical protein M1814_001124 [Vezdaea aestivalis]